VRESYLSFGVLAVPFRTTTDLARPALLVEGGRRFWDRSPQRRWGCRSSGVATMQRSPLRLVRRVERTCVLAQATAVTVARLAGSSLCSSADTARAPMHEHLCRDSLLLALVLFGCMDQGLDPYERWRSYDPPDYTIDQVRDCFCELAGQAVRISVRADTIASVVNLADGSEVPDQMARWFLTVDSLFGIIRNSSADSLVMTFNETYGYPEMLDINPQLHPVDGGVLYRTSNLRIP
jgi:hypothetical protein